MISTFFGIETARRAIQTATQDIDVTGQNVANASTPGYTEEVAQNTATDPYTTPMQNNPDPGQFGTGVEVSQISRSVDPWVNQQVNTSDSTLNYWQNLNNQLQVAQSAFQEPTANGLQSTMDNFFNSWQTLSEDPTNMGARATVVSDAQAIINDFHTSSGLLSQTGQNIQSQMQNDVVSINSMATQIAALNQQIASVTAQGQQPNDLEDKRDLLVSQLSQLVPVAVTNNNDGTAAVNIYGEQVVGGSSSVANVVSMTTIADSTPSGYDNVLSVAGNATTIYLSGSSLSASYASSGGLTGLEAARQKTGDYLNQLDGLAYNLVNSVNSQHEQGYGLNGTTWSVQGLPFFTALSATVGASATISLSTTISPNIGGAEPNLDAIAASATTTDPRDGNNAVAMANLQNSTTVGLPNSATFDGYYQTTTEAVGADVQNATNMQNTASATNTQLVNMQQSVSGVSTDAEMTKLVQYQYAYQAAAQFLSVQDKLLNTLINGTLQ